MKRKFTFLNSGLLRKNNFLQKSLLGLTLLAANYSTSFAQCSPDTEAPVITCPSNITINNNPGACDATVIYAAPVATDNCSSPGVHVYNFTGGMQTFTVPAGVTSITIEVNGAQGGNGDAGTGGNGAQMTGDFTVVPGQVLDIMVGEQPTNSNGGGGGTFVVDQTSGNPMIIAGGGGGGAGSCCGNINNGVGGVTSMDGTAGVNASGGTGAGGTGGNGGGVGSDSQNGGAGGGFYTNGANGFCSSTGGASYLTGGAGGTSGGAPLMNGGFGGGGGGHNCGWTYGAGGGGGGYSGGGSSGGGSEWGGGGGGGSFNAGTNQSNTAAINTGHGSVTITYTGGGLTVSLLSGLTSGSTFPLGMTMVSYEAEDAASNTSQCSFEVTVIDAEGPTADAVSLSDVTAECEATPATPTATDNCSGTVTVSSDVTFPITAQGLTVVTWSYEDDNGNISTQTQNVILTDNTDPVVDVVTLPDFNSCNNGNPPAPTATDNCGGTLLGIPDVTLPISTLGTTLVTWTYDDGNGNLITQTQNVIVSALDVTTSMTDVITITATTSGASYQWIDCDNANLPISGATNQSYSATANGNYAVIVNNGTCADTSACVAISSVGISENAATKINIYPSPTSGDYVIDLGQVYETVSVQITDLGGKVIESYVLNNTSKIQDTFDGAKGMYLVQIRTEIKNFTATLVIE